jgi:hypothetical protein
MAYAESTNVAVERSLSEIVAMVKKAGAQRVAQAETEDGFAIQFFLKDRMLRFRVPTPTWEQTGDRRGARPATQGEREATAAQKARQRARALLLVIKAKLESVESGVETLEEAFLANVVMPDGKTIGDLTIPAIAQAYTDGKAPPLLLPMY